MSSDQKISVLILTRNEEGSVAAVVSDARRYADEVLVVDGRSEDATRERAEAAGARVILDDGRGKGAGVRIGLRWAEHPVVVIADADGSHNMADIPVLTAPILDGSSDLVIASRLLGGSDEIHGNLSNYLRMVGAGFITLLVNWRFGTRLTDIENGFRALRRAIVPTLQLDANGFEIEQQLVLRALKRGFRVSEVPSHEYVRQAGQSKLPTIQGLAFLWHLLRELL
jgi:glycosyltransferase involved in cell wall biosynthesis